MSAFFVFDNSKNNPAVSLSAVGRQLVTDGGIPPNFILDTIQPAWANYWLKRPNQLLAVIPITPYSSGVIPDPTISGITIQNATPDQPSLLNLDFNNQSNIPGGTGYKLQKVSENAYVADVMPSCTNAKDLGQIISIDPLAYYSIVRAVEDQVMSNPTAHDLTSIYEKNQRPDFNADYLQIANYSV
jgi:hypothetical protein